jgi:hypothetical protein
MKRLIRIKKPVAAFMLLLFTFNMLAPSVAYALTSGPAQPEMKGFEPASTSNLVDVSSGDFTYNIPLMDVGGYPVNIAYHSGTGMDDEASWVGLGWSLNPGVIDRQMRGLPDDFKGDGVDGDKITKEFHMRNDITGGIKFAVDPELFGFNLGNIVQIGPEGGIFYNNKRGLGVEFGLSASAPLLSSNKNNAGTNTAGLSASAQLTFNSQAGASFNPAINFSIMSDKIEKSEKFKSSLSAGINSRSGLQYVSLGASYNSTKQQDGKKVINSQNASYTSYAAQTFTPETQADFFNQTYSVSPQIGAELWGAYFGIQLTGHYSSQKVAHTSTTYNAYGFLNSYKAKTDGRALMDFNREKDVPYFDGVPNLPVPVATPDLFMATAQDGAGQYRAYLGGTGIFSDHDATNTSVQASIGGELGAGGGFKTGVDVQGSISKTSTGKWETGDKFFFQDDNSFNQFGNFFGNTEVTDPGFEPVYFKRVGEQIPSDGGIFNKVKGTLPVRIKTRGSTSGPTAESVLTGKDRSETVINQKITRDKRDVRNNSFSYLTAAQARVAGLDKKIYDYYQAAGGFKPFLNKCPGLTSEVLQPYKKNHHIGEITITDEGGARKIYGLPAYNTYQEDASFSIEHDGNINDKSRGLVNYTNTDASTNNKKGTDYYYSKEIIPAYAHSFLLTGVLSNDYVDLKNDGITDDDLGTAVKFNYWRKTNNFQWRTPYAAGGTPGTGKANYNEGLISDTKDDKGNYSYGTKELWYVHSIESKTMVAVFETADRADALGADVMGNKDQSLQNRQQYLKTIKLYSKADWYKNQSAAIPVKTVNFVYDYSLFADNTDITKGVPNNVGQVITPDINMLGNQGGKLTLKKIFFTYQQNTKGLLQPYEFKYNFNKSYEWKQYDRWGNYKNVNDGNPTGVSNDYYAYSTQDKTKADANASLWQLTEVATPAGGIIKVQYESDDYSYVQNKKAMQMYPMVGVGRAVNDNSGYYLGDKIFVKLPEALGSDAELRAKYFDGGVNDYSKNLYFKAYVRLRKTDEFYDYVAGYADINNINTDVKLAAGYNDVAEIKVKMVRGENVFKDYHPIAKAAWQFMRLNTPKLVYPGYNVSEESGPMQFVKALMGAISSVSELMAPFDTRAEIKNLAPSIDLSKSWVRLDASTNSTKKVNGANYNAKLGGGARVKEVSMSDEWNTMSGSQAETAVYGMTYDYTTTMKLANGAEVISSSGVASYEPMIGNDENPFHQPNKYEQKIKLGPNNSFFIEEPLCESYFPGASINYSKVTVRNKGADGQVGSTGFTVSEFYTAKDYPTIVNHTEIDAKPFGGTSILQLLKIKKNNSRVLSQGYTIELNDMQGKPKSEKVIDKGGNEISSAYYYYKTVNPDAPEKRLNNETLVLQKDGTVTNAVIGRDVEMYSDMRSQTSFTAGINVMINIDAIYLLFAIIPIPTVLPLPNAEYTGFRSASTIKVIQQYGILDKVVKKQNGSQITTENLAWDANTGEVLLTRSQNEFDDPVYNLNYPSHWSYEDGMGPAYRNIGLVIAGFNAANGNITPTTGTSFLVSGDELLIQNSSGVYTKYWVNNVGTSSTPNLVLIDKDGIPATVNGSASIIRSGRRNLHSMAVGAMVSLINPIKNGQLNIGVFTKVLDANGSTYNDEWAIEAKNVIKTTQECLPGYTSIEDAAFINERIAFYTASYNSCIQGGGGTSCDVVLFQLNYWKNLLPHAGQCYKDTTLLSDPTYSINTTATRIKNVIYSTAGTILTSNASAWNSGTTADPAGASILNTASIWRNTIQGAGDNDGPLNRSGIWPVANIDQNYTFNNDWIGIKSSIYIASTAILNKTGTIGNLFLGFGGDNNIEVYIDNILVAAHNRNNDNTASSPFRSWRIKPINITLDQQHEIFIRVLNQVANSPGTLGVEIYDNSFSQFSNNTCINEICMPCNNSCAACKTANPELNLSVCNSHTLFTSVIWSTKCLVGKRFNYANLTATATAFAPICSGNLLPPDTNCNIKCQTTQRLYTQKISRSVCTIPFGQIINPYTTGLRGNWRMQKSFAYHADRESKLPYIKPGDPDVKEKTDIRKSGAYNPSFFYPFWKFENNKWLSQEQQSLKDPNWVKASEMTAFNQKGQEIENVDALNRYSSAQFGYLQSVPTAVASNARYTDIAYDGFEDYDFDVDNCNANIDTCNLDGHFSIRKLSRRFPSAIIPDQAFAHTGRNSLKIVPGANEAAIVKQIIPVTSNTLYTFSVNNMLLTDKGILNGFKPQPGKTYLLSAWIKDIPNAVPNPNADQSTNVQLVANETSKAAVEITSGGITTSTIKAGPRVEGWRKVEITFTVPVNASDIKIRFRPGSAVAYFDDIRIHPFDAQMKTYAYDNKSMRLWAELDENNFATFYEYDDEGILIRVKKETERGIMTIKETRSTYRFKK